MTSPTTQAAWRRLGELASEVQLPAAVHDDRRRFERFSVDLDGLLYDYSRQRVDQRVITALLELADQQELPAWRAKLYGGDIVNPTEQRAALHMALRARPGDEWAVGGKPVTDEVLAERARCYAFAEAVRDGGVRGATGARITDVVEIGIGGSHLGPALTCDALAAYGDAATRVHFISNADGADLGRTLARCRAESTLFVVASKTFTTQETLLNARNARNWLRDALGPSAEAAHFVAVAGNHAEARAFGIADDRIFTVWDWVGGRYSMWSAIGLPAMVMLGRRHFDALLDGARDIDLHFRDAPPGRNVPLLMGLIAVWNRNFIGAASHAVLPYAEALRLLPAYLQQLVMESLGKCVDREGRHMAQASAPVVWGMQGTNGQHAFYQLLHQGTDTIGIDFIGFRTAVEGEAGNQNVVLANLIAQAEALLVGSTRGDAHRDCAGGRASSILLFDRLDPRNLGRLVALYEHQVFVQAVLWGMNAFDQWGVELGKQMGRPLLGELRGGEPGEHDPATRGLLDYLSR